jgi:hypothetical protein
VFTVRAEEARVSRLEIVSQRFAFTNENFDTAIGYYQAFNQFDEDATSMVGSPIANSSAPVTRAQFMSSLGMGEIRLEFGARMLPGQSVSITLIDPVSTIFTSAILELGPPAQADSIVIGDLVVRGDNDYVTTDLELRQGLFNAYYPITVRDQYGNIMRDVTAIARSLVVSSAVYTRFADRGGEVVLELIGFNQAPGTADSPANNFITHASRYSIIFISMVNAARAEVVLDVRDALYVASFTINQPANIVVLGDNPILSYTAVDQYGNEIKSFDTIMNNRNGISIAGLGLEFYRDFATNDLIIRLNTRTVFGGDATIGGTVTITTMPLRTARAETAFISVRDSAFPASINPITGNMTILAARGGEAGMSTFHRGHINTSNQHGSGTINYNDFNTTFAVGITARGNEAVSLESRNPGVNGGTIEVGGVTYHRIAGDNRDGGVTVTAVSNTATTVVLTASLFRRAEDAWELVPGADRNFTMNIVLARDIQSFVVTDPGVMYRYHTTGFAYTRNDKGDIEYVTPTVALTDSRYHRTINVRGRLANGTEVELYPSLVQGAASIDTGILGNFAPSRSGDGVAFRVYSMSPPPSNADHRADATATVLVLATNGVATSTITREVRLSRDRPVRAWTGIEGGIGLDIGGVRHLTAAQILTLDGNFLLEQQAQLTPGATTGHMRIRVRDTYGVDNYAPQTQELSVYDEDGELIRTDSYTISYSDEFDRVQPIFYTLNQTMPIYEINNNDGRIRAHLQRPANMAGAEITFTAHFADGNRQDLRIKVLP